MLCPKCYGTSWLDPIGPCIDGSYITSRPCNYPGCHNGHVNCCDGLIETEVEGDKDEDRK